MKDIIKVLIANRGEIACRILKTLDRMGIAGVVVYHGIDKDSPAVKMAEEAVEIQGQPPVSAYLNIDQIVSACKKTGASAVHPGFGFLAENPAFARRLSAEGITFIGPGAQAMELMGNKIMARSFCVENHFPLAPSVTESGPEGDFITKAKATGVPLLIKAAAGGGSKGMRAVNTADNMPHALAGARREAKAAYGSDMLFLEKRLEPARHIEFPLLADQHGARRTPVRPGKRHLGGPGHVGLLLELGLSHHVQPRHRSVLRVPGLSAGPRCSQGWLPLPGYPRHGSRSQRRKEAGPTLA